MTPLYRTLERHLGARLAGPALAAIYTVLLASIVLLANLDGLVPIIYLDMP